MPMVRKDPMVVDAVVVITEATEVTEITTRLTTKVKTKSEPVIVVNMNFTCLMDAHVLIVRIDMKVDVVVAIISNTVPILVPVVMMVTMLIMLKPLIIHHSR